MKATHHKIAKITQKQGSDSDQSAVISPAKDAEKFHHFHEKCVNSEANSAILRDNPVISRADSGKSTSTSSFVLRHGSFLEKTVLFLKIRFLSPWRSNVENKRCQTGPADPFFPRFINIAGDPLQGRHPSDTDHFANGVGGKNVSKFGNYIRNSKRIRITGSTASVMLSLLLLATLVPLYNITNTSNSEAAAGTAQDSKITFTGTKMNASVDLTVASTSGTFATSSAANQASFSVSTNNSQGYTLTLESSASGTGATNLTNSTSGTSLSTISTSSTSSSFTNGTWGLLPSSYKSGSTITDGNATTYFPAPTSGNALTLDSTSSANAEAKSYTIGIGAKADFSTASGTYTKAETYTIAYVANPTNYQITSNKNTTDTVSNMPYSTTSNVLSGNVSSTSININSGSGYSRPTRTGYDFKGWCSVATTTTNKVDSCSGTTYDPNGNSTNLAFGIDRTTTNTTTLYAMWSVQTFTCSKQYRLEDANGSWGSYTADGSETVEYGGSCSYTKSVTNYKNSSTGTNGASASTSASNITSNQTLSLSFYRNTYALTVSAGTNTSNATGSGTYRWGQTVTVSVTKASNSTCTTYATPSWSRTAGSGTLNSTSGTSVTFTMTTSTATVQATSSSSNATYTITFKTSNASSITFNGTNKSNNATGTYACGNYSISGNYASGYGFSSWSRTGSGGFTTSSTSTSTTSSSSTASTYFRVQGTATITLTGAATCTSTLSGYMQSASASSAYCDGASGTMTDRRDNNTYTVKKINGNLWMTQNLRITGTIAATYSNFTGSSVNISEGDLTAGDSYTAARTHDSGNTTNGVWYNFCAASAKTGNGCSSSASYTSSTDICPSGWRLPTRSEFSGITSYSSAFSPITGGRYDNGSFYNGYGYWWSATAYDSSHQYNLYYDGSSLSASSYGKDVGLYVRCIRTS